MRRFASFLASLLILVIAAFVVIAIQADSTNDPLVTTTLSISSTTSSTTSTGPTTTGPTTPAPATTTLPEPRGTIPTTSPVMPLTTTPAPPPTTPPTTPTSPPILAPSPSNHVIDNSPSQLTITLAQNLSGGSIRRQLVSCPSVGSELCQQLTQVETSSFRLPVEAVCSAIYGGPAQAVVTGSLHNHFFSTTFSLTNGCQISRWYAFSWLIGSPPITAITPVTTHRLPGLSVLHPS